GIGISTEALFQRAAQLPRVALVTPKTVICKNTVTGMQAGVIFGFVGQIDEIVRRIKAEMKQEMKVIATGGMAKMISRESKTIDKVDNFLTLTGLRVLYERNLSADDKKSDEKKCEDKKAQ
ncbi:MAG: type III pantothenate kinase, partial [Schwartzia sp.]|nr:type III pantothenate kinase [Schwartzia sp. (in: firmicutes)]